MAYKLTIGVWNLYNFGTPSLNPTYDGNLKVAYIAKVIAYRDVDIIFFLEVKTAAATSFISKVVQKLGSTQYNGKTNPWKGKSFDAKGNNESYIVLWRNDTQEMKSAASNGATSSSSIQLLDSIDKLGSTTSGGNAKYHTFTTRRPGYTLFKVTQSGNNYYFFVIGWHAASKPKSYTDIEYLPELYIVEKKKSESGSSGVALKYGFIMADFNVDLDTTNEAQYYDLLQAWSTHQATTEKTHIYNNASDNTGNKNNPLDYRNSAIDNIFTNWATSQVGNSLVDDMIVATKSGGYLYNYGRNLSPINFNYSSNEDAVMPPTTVKDAFKTYRGAISDHYPVFQIVTYTT